MFWRHATGVLSLDKPRVVGILNVTPDSFSDGGALRTLDEVRRSAECLVADGADVIDIGGESTRPRAVPVTGEEELRRVMPAIRVTLEAVPGVPVSVDTVKARVAAEAIAAGASIINDVSGFRLDSDMAGVCASSGAGVVLMHSRGDVADMATFVHAVYGEDPVGDVIAELRTCVERATLAGVGRERIVLDPGIGFSKRGEQSLAMLAQLGRFVELGFPILVGVSRKRFIGEITGVGTPTERVAGTVGANVMALQRGARLFRVHDVKPAREALDVAWAIMHSGPT
jgi:dihydropteroate synthase